MCEREETMRYVGPAEYVSLDGEIGQYTCFLSSADDVTANFPLGPENHILEEVHGPSRLSDALARSNTLES